MARKKKTWTPKQGNWKSESMAAAYKAVTEGTLGVREAATQYNIPKSTLSWRLKRGIPSTLPTTRLPVFSIDDENQLVSHIKDIESQGFGIGLKAVYKLPVKHLENSKLYRTHVIVKAQRITAATVQGSMETTMEMMKTGGNALSAVLGFTKLAPDYLVVQPNWETLCAKNVHCSLFQCLFCEVNLFTVKIHWTVWLNYIILSVSHLPHFAVPVTPCIQVNGTYSCRHIFFHN